ncbi:MAG: hypothetical protein GXP63_01120 [DPANN group archaeon]|nr:hypothetical protein [DPANN group archaeon]
MPKERQKVLDYIEHEIKKGYQIENIRQVLVEHGYDDGLVDTLIRESIADLQQEAGAGPAGESGSPAESKPTKNRTGEAQATAPVQADGPEKAQRIPDTATSTTTQKAGQADADTTRLRFLREDFIHLRMPSRDHTFLVIIPTALGIMALGTFLMGLRVRLFGWAPDWALIKFAVYLIAGTLTAKAIAHRLSTKGMQGYDDAIFEKVMRFGFIIYLLSLAMDGRMLMGFVVLGVLVLAYALARRTGLSLWRSVRMTTLFASLGLAITYGSIAVSALAIGLLKARGLI